MRFRLEPNRTSRTVFLLQSGDCVIVLARVREEPVQAALSGGWLRVATTACGLYL